MQAPKRVAPERRCEFTFHGRHVHARSELAPSGASVYGTSRMFAPISGQYVVSVSAQSPGGAMVILGRFSAKKIGKAWELVPVKLANGDYSPACSLRDDRPRGAKSLRAAMELCALFVNLPEGFHPARRSEAL